MLVIVVVHKLGTKNSNGMTAFCPYTNLNGVFPINILHVVLYVHNIYIYILSLEESTTSWAHARVTRGRVIQPLPL